jgi:predicted DsbA family dithiol-disulfide isomerase
MTHLKIDIVSDVSCPWCIIGYQALNQALSNLAPDIQADITWKPFELNPQSILLKSMALLLSRVNKIVGQLESVVCR